MKKLEKSRLYLRPYQRRWSVPISAEPGAQAPSGDEHWWWP